MNTRWLTLSEAIVIELEQASDEGRDVSAYREEAKIIKRMYDNGIVMEKEADALIEKMKTAPLVSDYPYEEPSGLEDIRACRPKNKKVSRRSTMDRTEYYDKVYGAWLGRVAGCLLGQPIEGWKRERIIGLLKDTGNYPPTNYISSDISESLRKKYAITDVGKVYGSNQINWINNISHAPEDDDTNYTVLNLKIMEEKGDKFSPEDMADNWMMNLPFLHACTAERVAYRNFMNGIAPPLSGTYKNAYREWIGAQIRADFFGYMTKGNPEYAAELAWRDASISHSKNGIYGEMFVAAMLACAMTSSDIEEIIHTGLQEIPEKSRLHEAITEVLAWKREGLDWEGALSKVCELYDEGNHHHWCHTISNAMICVVALLWGDGDYEKTIAISICPGFDTDCNAATVGSIIGMIHGAKEMPEKWIAPLDDRLITGIDGFGLMRISELAGRTVDVAMSLGEAH